MAGIIGLETSCDKVWEILNDLSKYRILPSTVKQNGFQEIFVLIPKSIASFLPVTDSDTRYLRISKLLKAYQCTGNYLTLLERNSMKEAHVIVYPPDDTSEEVVNVPLTKDECVTLGTLIHYRCE